MPHSGIATPEATPAVERALLQKRIPPTTPQGLATIGGRMLPRDDVVLTQLALSDEREYQKMFDTAVSVSSAVEQRINGLLEHGSEVVVGDSGSPEAEMLRDFSIRFLKGIPHWHTLQREMLMSVYYGWRPESSPCRRA